MLMDFISTHREELIERARAKVASRSVPPATMHELTNGVPLFLTQLGEILRREASQAPPNGVEMGKSAALHGGDLLQQGFSLPQVVHDYGDVCQAVTELAIDLDVGIDTEDFHTLNRCLDNAIASAVTEYSRQRDVDVSGAETMRQGILAHELRNHLNTALLAFQAVKSGKVGITGSTMEVLERSLLGLRELIDRSVSEVRLAAGTHQTERVHVATIIENVGAGASIEAAHRGLRLNIESGDPGLQVDVDRNLFASAISNLLHNAFKYTRPSGQVWLRTHATADRIYIEVEDECGGLLPGAAEAIFQPFQQRGADRSGMGLGLTISRQAVEADGGEISFRNIPGKGCVFIVDAPLAVAEA
jgi:signal transduction histidine kinase